MNDCALLFEFNQDSIALSDLIRNNTTHLDWALRYYISLDVADAVCHLHEHYQKAVHIGEEEKLTNCIDFYLASSFIDVYYAPDPVTGVSRLLAKVSGFGLSHNLFGIRNGLIKDSTINYTAYLSPEIVTNFNNVSIPKTLNNDH